MFDYLLHNQTFKFLEKCNFEEKLISQGALKTAFGMNNGPIFAPKVSKDAFRRSYNNRFLRNWEVKNLGYLVL